MVHGSKPSLIVQAVLDAAGRKTWYRNDDITEAFREVLQQREKQLACS
jgi:hypothetical protein